MPFRRFSFRAVTAAAAVTGALALVAAAPAAAAPIPLRGTTSQAKTVQFKLQLVGPRGKLSGSLQYEEICEKAGPLGGHLTSSFTAVKVSSSGRFHVGKASVGTVSLGNGYVGTLELKSFIGSFKSDGAVVGSFDMAMTVADSEGNPMDSCDTRTVHFRAE